MTSGCVTLCQMASPGRSASTNKGFERAADILHTAREIFAREGYSQLSMRGVAARCGITLGTVQHYYPTRESLFEAMLLQLLEDMQAQADEMADAHAKASPSDGFRGAMRYFIAMVNAPLQRGMFGELNALSLRDRFASRVMDEIFARARKSIGRRIRVLVPTISPKENDLRAALVLAQLMGLTYVHDEGLKDASIETMLAIALGNHRR
jgi:TetR/AcrR family transcriptional regulator